MKPKRILNHMSTVLEFRRPRRCQTWSKRSGFDPRAILTQVGALVSTVETQEPSSAEDLGRAIFILELANASIRLLIGQLSSRTTANQLISQSERIDQLLTAARGELRTLFEKQSFEPGAFNLGDCDEGEQPKGQPRTF